MRYVFINLEVGARGAAASASVLSGYIPIQRLNQLSLAKLWKDIPWYRRIATARSLHEGNSEKASAPRSPESTVKVGKETAKTDEARLV